MSVQPCYGVVPMCKIFKLRSWCNTNNDNDNNNYSVLWSNLANTFIKSDFEWDAALWGKGQGISRSGRQRTWWGIEPGTFQLQPHVQKTQGCRKESVQPAKAIWMKAGTTLISPFVIAFWQSLRVWRVSSSRGGVQCCHQPYPRISKRSPCQRAL